MKEYIEFLKDKMAISHQTGFEVRPEEISPYLYSCERYSTLGCVWRLQSDILQLWYAENRNPVGNIKGDTSAQKR